MFLLHSNNNPRDNNTGPRLLFFFVYISYKSWETINCWYKTF
ncbi:hypothetical protein FRUB_06340 [Fimbriiglobus ruber]|uniref:Uncharacterized protein n=1 Tax=Fimbriiglobus ruber TaxID=1908690 RepID=A0A225DH17_9BACT|nr:hypothetical protein FRUB_06306 [Fimbriiglobus ruber]OWK38964.1 hypothetical protein FRUB_06340 [Fimbriiglobus ruber]